MTMESEEWMKNVLELIMVLVIQLHEHNKTIWLYHINKNMF